jgi:hypothetical protein
VATPFIENRPKRVVHFFHLTKEAIDDEKEFAIFTDKNAPESVWRLILFSSFFYICFLFFQSTYLTN